ncbi:CBM35 domain-containing protein [Streptomyces sp. NPDC048208]|uniref:CBM35 domain-containing protein n=1 Tax=unclassified Streptomyces TaxID=2593676 RepID=UPI00371E3982
MTPGDNGASKPEEDDPFGYLYADGQARGAQPPSGGYGYPNAVNRVRAVGERKYGQPQQAAPTQAGAYGQPNGHYQAPETLPGGAPTSRQAMHSGGGGGRRGPNTKGLLIGAIAVVAAVVIGISVAMLNGKDDDGKTGNQADASPTQSQEAPPSPKATSTASAGELPKADAVDDAVQLAGGAAPASAVKGSKSAGGSYVGGMNQVGASVTWTVDVPKSGKYTLNVGYGVPGKDANATLTVNGTSQNRPLNLANFAKAPEGDWERGWTHTWANLELQKGSNTVSISCGNGNQCDVNLDQFSLESGWR